MRLLPIPADADPSSLKTPEDYPDEVEKRREAAAKWAQKVLKDKAREEKNLELLKSDLEEKKKKRESAKKESCSKNKHGPEYSGSSKPRRKRLSKRTKKAASENSQEADENLSPVQSDDNASERNEFEENALVRASPVNPSPVKVFPKRKTPKGTVTMADSINTDSLKGGIDMTDMIVAPRLTSEQPKKIAKTSANRRKKEDEIPLAQRLIKPLATQPPTSSS